VKGILHYSLYVLAPDILLQYLTANPSLFLLSPDITGVGYRCNSGTWVYSQDRSIVGECGGSDVGGGWKIGGVEEVKKRTNDTTVGDSCMGWK
jgi:hypothetical protein